MTHEAGIPGSWQFQIDLAEVLGQHRTDLSLYNELVELIQHHSNGKELRFTKDLEENLMCTKMKPLDIDVELMN